MLALIGVLTIVIMLVLIMTKKLQTLLALIIVPIIGCLVAGFTGNIVLEEVCLPSRPWANLLQPV